jgi:hypothetical protein
VDRVAALVEQELERICRRLGIKVGGSFLLYLYDDVQDLAKTTGLGGTAGFYAWLGARPGFNAYDLAASYFLFLLDKYGAARTTRYYTGVSAKTAFGVSQKQLEKRWHAALDRFPMRPEVEKLLDRRHGPSVRLIHGRNTPAGLPSYILGKPREWKSLMKAKLSPRNDAKWTRRGSSMIGTSDEATWSVCELGTKRYGDCVVRATIEIENPSPIQLRLGEGNQGMLVNGTFL